jgi:ketosteroid isomerase-like protein
MSSTPNTATVETMKAFAQAWNNHDLEALMSFVTDDCEFHAVGGPDILGRTFKGTAQLREGFAMAWQACPDASWSDGDYFASGDRGVAECTFAGTKSDGSRIEARMVDVFTFRDGKIAIKNAFRKDRPTIAAH